MKHSKFSAIVLLYNLKFMGGWSNTSFSLLLEFFNKLIPQEARLAKHTYQAKKVHEGLEA